MATYTLKQGLKAGIRIPLACSLLMQQAERAGGKAYVLDEHKRMPDLPLTIVFEVPAVSEEMAGMSECGGVPILLVVDGMLTVFHQLDRAAWQLDTIQWRARRMTGFASSGARLRSSRFEAPGVRVHLYDRRHAGAPSEFGFSVSTAMIHVHASGYKREVLSLGIPSWAYQYGKVRPVDTSGRINVRTGTVVFLGDEPPTSDIAKQILPWVRETAVRAGIAEW